MANRFGYILSIDSNGNEFWSPPGALIGATGIDTTSIAFPIIPLVIV